METFFDILVNIINALAALSIAVIAILGYINWRKRELWERDKYEIAKRVLTYSFRLRDKIKVARSPFISAGEWTDREQREDEREEEARILDTHYALSERLSPILDLRAEYETIAVEVEALWGDEYKRYCKALIQHFLTLIHSLNTHTRMSLSTIRRGSHQSERTLIENADKIIYSSSTEFKTDEYDTQLDEIVNEIERQFGDVVRGRKKIPLLIRLRMKS